MSRPVVTLLYAPLDRPDLAAKALAGGADVVVLDLEDAVAPTRKEAARAALPGLLAAVPAGRGVQVRINAAHSPWHADDLAAVAELAPDVGLRLPKARESTEVRSIAAASPGRALHLILEDALGVERAYDLATADPAVASIGLGEADLRSDLGVDDEAGLTWARSRVVNAARAAGLPAPAMSVYPHVTDLDGLRASCRTGRLLGFVGRAAIHPRQLDPIRESFRPTAAETARAREVLERIAGASEAGVGALVLADGTFVDVAMVERARTVVALAGPGAERR